MQMYRVRFARKLPKDLVDIGDCLVCAGNADAASDMVAGILRVPLASTEFEVTRVKPSLYLIGRKEVDKKMPDVSAELVDVDLACTATFPGITENLPDEYWHEVQASAQIIAENEEEAVTKLARALIRYITGQQQISSTKELDVKADRSAFRPKESRADQNALYTHLRFFQGGDTRGK